MALNRRWLMAKLQGRNSKRVLVLLALCLWVCVIVSNRLATLVQTDSDTASGIFPMFTIRVSQGNQKQTCDCQKLLAKLSDTMRRSALKAKGGNTSVERSSPPAQQIPPSNQSIAVYNKTAEEKPTLIRFTTIVQNDNINNLAYDNVHLFPCRQPNGPGADGIEDLMCLPRPSYLPEYKNPCYYDDYQVLQCMPYYNILGFDKCGTTDLSFRLQIHPSILKIHAFRFKEVYFWGWRRFGVFMNTSIWVMKLKDYAFTFSNATFVIGPLRGQLHQPITGDGGPLEAWAFHTWKLDPQNTGLSEPKVLIPHHMRHILKDPKFIVLMRDPVERLYSDYVFLYYGNSPAKFARDATRAVDMMNACLKVNTTRQCFFSHELYLGTPARLLIGCYSVYLREWFSVFHRKHFLFIRTEDYMQDIKGTLRTVFSFLGIDTLPDSAIDIIAKQEKILQNARKKEAGPMWEETRKLLQDFYEPCNRDLAELLQDDRYLWHDT